MPRKEKEYSFALKINGEQVMTGDKLSIGVIFNNLSGSNFAEATNPAAEHTEWISFMEWSLKVPLPHLSEVKMISPENTLLHCCCIGEGLPRPDPEVGLSYMVKTCPPGALPIWHKATLYSHSSKTSTTRELFHFNAGGFVLPVTRAEVKERVMPLQPKG